MATFGSGMSAADAINVAPQIYKGISDDPERNIFSGNFSAEQKVFLVVAVALATLCFFTNAFQACVYLKPSNLKSVKGLLILSQSISGIFAAFVVVFPVKIISTQSGAMYGKEGFSACYLGHSGIILVAVLTALSTSTLLLFLQYRTNRQPKKFQTVPNNLMGWGAILVGVWCYSFGIAVLPWVGWNSWVRHDSKCHLSTLWPLSFTTFLTFIVGLHIMAAILMCTSIKAENFKLIDSRAKREQETRSAEDTESITHVIIRSRPKESKIAIYVWLVTIWSIIPLVGHVVFTSSCAASLVCQSSEHHYHESESSLPWTSLFITAAAILNPLFHMFSDEQKTSNCLKILSKICCGFKRGNFMRSRGGTSEQGGVCVTNDTQLLVGDTA